MVAQGVGIVRKTPQLRPKNFPVDLLYSHMQSNFAPQVRICIILPKTLRKLLLGLETRSL